MIYDNCSGDSWSSDTTSMALSNTHCALPWSWDDSRHEKRSLLEVVLTEARSYLISI
jgi:hypothetical protein